MGGRLEDQACHQDLRGQSGRFRSARGGVGCYCSFPFVQRSGLLYLWVLFPPVLGASLIAAEASRVNNGVYWIFHEAFVTSFVETVTKPVSFWLFSTT